MDPANAIDMVNILATLIFITLYGASDELAAIMAIKTPRMA
jgi:hypothetical protein